MEFFVGLAFRQFEGWTERKKKRKKLLPLLLQVSDAKLSQTPAKVLNHFGFWRQKKTSKPRFAKTGHVDNKAFV